MLFLNIQTEEIKNSLSLVQEIKKLFLCSRLTNLFDHIEVFDASASLLGHTYTLMVNFNLS